MTTITDEKLLITIKVYTVAGHLALLAGSIGEAKLIAEMLFKNSQVYKVQCCNYSGNKVFELV